MLLEQETIDELDRSGIIDKRFPIWWSNGFEDRECFEPDRFFGDLVDFEGKLVQLGEEDENIRFTVLKEELYGMEVPLFVTAKPVAGYWQKTIRELGWQDCFGFVAESYPHIRGIALSFDDDVFYWYPMRSDMKLDSEIEFGGIKLKDYSYNTDHRSFFSGLISHHMALSRKTYYNINYKEDDYNVPDLPFVPFYEFRNGNEMMVIPSECGGKVHLPALVIGRRGEDCLIRGFTDSVVVYSIHKRMRRTVRDYVKESFGLDCEVYSKSPS
jgi:hypothetical protein